MLFIDQQLYAQLQAKHIDQALLDHFDVAMFKQFQLNQSFANLLETIQHKVLNPDDALITTLHNYRLHFANVLSIQQNVLEHVLLQNSLTTLQHQCELTFQHARNALLETYKKMMTFVYKHYQVQDAPLSNGEFQSFQHSLPNFNDVQNNQQLSAYQLFGLPTYADQHQLKKAYLRLSKLYHPDVNKSVYAAQMMTTINAAYALLSEQG